MNHFSLDLPPSDTFFYSSMDNPHPHHKSPFPFFCHQHNHPPLSLSHPDDDSEQSSSAAAAANDTASSSADHREPMFEKPLTPSDVGKLNRLVIPKQHAEKYFPLSASASAGDGGSGGGGILLGFEDECGRCWRFRYSYWNSSQSYVLTKGWSRYVKEKKLDAGDVVFFDRHRFEPDRFFIGWRRRGAPAQPPPGRAEFGGWSHRSSYNGVQQGYPAPQPQRIAASFPFLTADSFHAGTEVRQQSQKPARSGGMNPKRLRLFGVNLECQLEDDQDAEPQTSDGSSLSSQGPILGSGSGPSGGPVSYNYFDYMGYPPNHHNHMDMNFPQDVKQMRNRLG